MKIDKNKDLQKPGNKETSLVRSSAAEYLTFVAAGGRAETSVEMRYEDENIWLTQKMMAGLYDVSIPAVNLHLKRIFDDHELEESAVVKQYLITAVDGKNYNTKHYNLQDNLHAIIAVGFKIENERAVQFRKWANQIVKDYTIQGWTMDEERLKHYGVRIRSFQMSEMSSRHLGMPSSSRCNEQSDEIGKCEHFDNRISMLPALALPLLTVLC
jgi:hypothetical protein